MENAANTQPDLSKPPTTKSAAAASAVVIAVAETIRELGNIPSGHLYARVMNHIDLPLYNKIIDTLVNLKFVKNENHLLTWIGPVK